MRSLYSRWAALKRHIVMPQPPVYRTCLPLPLPSTNHDRPSTSSSHSCVTHVLCDIPQPVLHFRQKNVGELSSIERQPDIDRVLVRTSTCERFCSFRFSLRSLTTYPSNRRKPRFKSKSQNTLPAKSFGISSCKQILATLMETRYFRGEGRGGVPHKLHFPKRDTSPLRYRG